MSVRDCAPFAREAIESMLAQTLRDIEVIVVDDGSWDGTAAIVASIADSDARVRAIFGNGQAGWVTSINEACEVARGTYIARMDGDDVAAMHRLARQVREFDAAPDLVLLGSDIDLIDTRGAPAGQQRFPRDNDAIRERLVTEKCFAQSSVMFRRSAFERAGRYRPAFTHAEDYDLWLRLAELGKVCNLPERLVAYRLHDGSNTARNLELQVASALAAQLAARARRAGRQEPFGATVVSPDGLIAAGVSRATLQRMVASQTIGWAMLGRNARSYEETTDLLERARGAVSGAPGMRDVLGRSYLAEARIAFESGHVLGATTSTARALVTSPALVRVAIRAFARFLRASARAVRS